ncbi:MAG TPA: hypothetical protein VGL08_14355 [Paraburkholderia sp.]|jgi:hypothetical protein
MATAPDGSLSVEAKVADLRNLTLHVFEQNGSWHWGLTVERLRGTGQKVVAFSEEEFGSEAQARADGERAYNRERSEGLHRSAWA